MAARKARTRKPPAAQCKPCKGTGEVSRTVRVGRKHREVGEQTGLCLNCFGTGEQPTA
ncbi:hypothetical protein H9Y04_30620 [Streptomyces sp. TRM66268-LWL]|uniref:Molecular chaperone DnaJ n=1 Tax=Streptomyces polyasparticus TaxID=2767826 RepID=A0ABR7SN34_9ACTN|nr:hypothetical protein [Streptomyces polyasparticus]MBC9716895.1 hypothetical protein [Streptomyces polyasparticus]